MFDIDKLASAILKIISEPIRKLADRLKAVEERPVIDLSQIKTINELLVSINARCNATEALVKNIKQDVWLEPIVEELQLIKGSIEPAPELPDIAGMIKASFDKMSSDIVPIIDELITTKTINIEEDLKSFIEEFVNSIPKPKDGIDGKNVKIEDVIPIIQSEIAKIPVPKDGVGASSAIIDRDGQLILTMVDGKMVNLGPVVGKDCDMALVDKAVAEKVAAIPKPRDGLDGFGFDDISMDYDGKRTFSIKFIKGDRNKEFNFKLVQTIYHGIYEVGKEYEVGDQVTWGGSMWHCKKDTKTKPGENSDWVLAVKKGRDGREVVSVNHDSKKPVKIG